MGEAVSCRSRGAPVQRDLTAEIDAIANQLCRAVDGDFGFKIDTQSGDATVQKLSLLINFMLENARDAIAAEAAARARLSAALETRQTLEQALEQKIAELREADQLRTLFLTNMHHELRTPMNAILGMSGILREMGQGADDPIRRFSQHLFDGAARLNDLIEQSLQFTKAAHGGIELRAEAISAAMLTARALRTAGRVLGEAGIRAAVAPEGLETRLMVDPALIRRVLANLIANAAKFAPGGGQLEISAGRIAEGFAFAIRDHGPGMTPSQVAAAVKQFRQMSEGAARSHEGAGLGLAVTEAILRRHGGRLSLEPADGGGLLARAWLPASRIVEPEM